ncbi:MAG TPA: NAD(P)-dependent oxidoreductase [Gaiellaceae bacterium]|nr:NAD(P)-dependent oxidoreductase [Gaiellaceae bacterium]
MGLIGLGNMGTAVAERVLGSGRALVVHNRSLEKAEPLRAQGAQVAETVGELATAVDIVLTSLADDEAFESVAADLAGAARPGTLLVDLSTVSPAASARVAVLGKEASLLYLRAPVSGNPSVVRAGNLTFIASGPPEALERAEPILLTVGRAIHNVGDAEQARVVKLAVNLVIGGLAELMAEALVLGEGSGVSRAALLETMGDSAAGAPFVKYKTEPLLRDDYSATFTTRLMEKDLDLVLAAAEDAGVRLPLAAEVRTLIRSAIDAGYGDDDFMALFPHLRDGSPEAVSR